MDKICETCVSSIKCYKEIDFKSPQVFMCNDLQYKQKIVDKAISEGNQNAAKLTSKEIRKLPFTTDRITSHCEFFKSK